MTQIINPQDSSVECITDRDPSSSLVLPATLVVIVIVVSCVALVAHGVPAAAAMAVVGSASALGLRVFAGTLEILIPGRSRG